MYTFLVTPCPSLFIEFEADAPDACTCTNGVAAIGEACTSANAVICTSCNGGYTLNGIVCQASMFAHVRSFVSRE